MARAQELVQAEERGLSRAAKVASARAERTTDPREQIVAKLIAKDIEALMQNASQCITKHHDASRDKDSGQ